VEDEEEGVEEEEEEAELDVGVFLVVRSVFEGVRVCRMGILDDDLACGVGAGVTFGVVFGVAGGERTSFTRCST